MVCYWGDEVVVVIKYLYVGFTYPLLWLGILCICTAISHTGVSYNN